jgi:hypothetical protein
VPKSAAGVCDDGKVRAPQGLRHEGQAQVPEGGPRLQYAPHPHRHRGRADAQDGAGALAECEGPDPAEIDVQQVDAFEYPDAGLLPAAGPAGRFSAAEEPDLDRVEAASIRRRGD